MGCVKAGKHAVLAAAEETVVYYVIIDRKKKKKMAPEKIYSISTQCEEIAGREKNTHINLFSTQVDLVWMPRLFRVRDAAPRISCLKRFHKGRYSFQNKLVYF